MNCRPLYKQQVVVSARGPVHLGSTWYNRFWSSPLLFGALVLKIHISPTIAYFWAFFCIDLALNFLGTVSYFWPWWQKWLTSVDSWQTSYPSPGPQGSILMWASLLVPLIKYAPEIEKIHFFHLSIPMPISWVLAKWVTQDKRQSCQTPKDEGSWPTLHKQTALRLPWISMSRRHMGLLPRGGVNQGTKNPFPSF